MVIYLDDIVVFSSSLEEHQVYLQSVFDKNRHNHLYMKKEKRVFAKQHINFLDHIIECEKIQMDEDKLQAIKEWEAPTFLTKLRSFLGLANCYHQFIEEFLRRVVPLTELLNKGTTWRWPVEC